MNNSLVIWLIAFATFLFRSISVAGDFFATHLERFLGPEGKVVTVVFWDAPIRVSHSAPRPFSTDLPNPFPAGQVLSGSAPTPSPFSSTLRAFSEPIRLTIGDSQPALDSSAPKKTQ